MTSFIDHKRPKVFCPGCMHTIVLKTLDKVFQELTLQAHEIVIVTDIGCCGLFDTFFKTHALHGLHGRALTYAAGLKLAKPDLHVVAIMGDGGVGIGAAHLIAACRRNLDITLLVLNNFNFGMTGGQYSVTTPDNASVNSGFLNEVEKPLDIGSLAKAAGAPYVTRITSYAKQLSIFLKDALTFHGFSLVDIWGVCPGRYQKQNKLTPLKLQEDLKKLPVLKGPVNENLRPEFADLYAAKAKTMPSFAMPRKIEQIFKPVSTNRQEVLILGAAGQRIQTAGEVLAMAGMSAGLHVSQKNEHNITVMRGPSISEVILSYHPIDFTGIIQPTHVIALAAEGINQRLNLIENLPAEALIIKPAALEVPVSKAKTITFDPDALGIKKADWAIFCLAKLARLNQVIREKMLFAALNYRFEKPFVTTVYEIVKKTIP